MAIFVCCALAGITGCDRGSASGSADDTITITYWAPAWWGDPSQFQSPDPITVGQWQRERIAEFERANPGVKVNVQIDPGGPSAQDKLRIAFAGRVPPDVFHGVPGQEFVTWAELGFLEPIDAGLMPEDRADVIPASLDSGGYRGQHYGWPLYNHALCVVVNRDLFRERGIEPPLPDADWTFDRFAEAARALTFDRDGDGRIDVYGVGLHTLDDNHPFLTTYLINHGAQVFDAETGRFVLDSEAGLKGIRFLRGLFDAGYVTPGASSYRQDEVRSLFFNGQVAMYLTNAGILDWAEDQVRKKTIARFDWALVPVPSVAEVERSTYLSSGMVYVSRQEDDRKRAACMALARYITSPEVNRYFWNRASPRLSSPLPSDPNMAVMMKEVVRGQNFMLSPNRLPDRFNLTQEMTALYQRVFARPSVGEAGQILKDTSAAINAKLDAFHQETSADE